MKAGTIKRRMLAVAVVLAPACLLVLSQVLSEDAKSQARADAGGGSGCPVGYGCGSIKMRPCCSFVPSCECSTAGLCTYAYTPIDIPKGVASSAGSTGVCIRATANSPCCEKEECQLDPPGCGACILLDCFCEGSGDPVQLFGAESESSGISCGGKQF